MNDNFTGILLAVLGGVLVGNCMAPLKKIRTWPWEATWLVFSFVSLLLVPCIIAAATVPDWPRLYASLTLMDLLPSLALGFGWGIAQVLFGISVVRLGMAVAFTVIVGLGTIFGTLIPLLVRHESDLASRSTSMLFIGCGLMAVGVALSGYAGKLREGSQPVSKQGYLAGLYIAILSGLLSCMLNLSLAFSDPIAHAATQHGTRSASVAFAVWPIALFGGLIPNAGYSILLLTRNKTWRSLSQLWPDVSFSTLMGLLWIGAVAIYGVSTRYMGKLGDSAGWAIYQISMVIAANTAGVIAGEWKSASRRAVVLLGCGVLVLIVATVVTAFSTK